MKQIRQKPRRQRGETIAETLIAILIAVLASMTLTAMAGVSVKIVRQSSDAMKSYYAGINKTEVTDREVTDRKEDDKTTITWSEDSQSEIPVTYHQRTVTKGRNVTSYRLYEAVTNTEEDIDTGGQE